MLITKKNIWSISYDNQTSMLQKGQKWERTFLGFNILLKLKAGFLTTEIQSARYYKVIISDQNSGFFKCICHRASTCVRSLFLSVVNWDNWIFTLLDYLKIIVILLSVLFCLVLIHYTYLLLNQLSTLPNKIENIWIFAEPKCSQSL